VTTVSADTPHREQAHSYHFLPASKIRVERKFSPGSKIRVERKFLPASKIRVERKSPVGAIGGYDGREAAAQ